ncbi:sensor histidine kinase [Candidatus Leptofilum sp.]|uniref:sensor histidine kinase n=1 Tax=Candidatus Leptofilum sp. TaxID=3241576 RepID=UPI003B5AE82F
MNNKVKILLVDDRPENLLALEAILDEPGYHLVTALSGDEALRYLLKQEFALILLDVRMPEMDGFEMARLVRERKKTSNIPIIFVTAEYKRSEHISLGYALQAIDYILKPFNPEILKAKVAVLVDLHSKTTQVKQQAELLRQSESHLEQLVRERTAKLEEANRQLQQEIAEHEETEKKLKKRTEQLEQANQEIKNFSYSISHDLRAPLRAIQGFAEILVRRHQDNLSEDGKHYVNNIIEASQQMEHLLQDLLEYSRLGRQTIHWQQVSLHKLLTRVVENLSGRMAKTGATIDLPPASALPIIMSDRTLLSQIFTNLIDNALIYQHPDLPPQVTIRCQNEADHVVVQVADNGIGIDPKFHEKIFDIFQRLHNYDDYPGTGIGLAIVKKSVELMDGRIQIESAAGKGSTFNIELPNRDYP